MIDSSNVPEISDDESLARYLTQSGHFRKSDLTIKQDAFIPHPHLELSVTRHLRATEPEIRQIGESIARLQNRPLYGRADVRALSCRDLGLHVDPDPLNDNPNHATVSKWPPLKQDQKLLALKLAAAAKFVPVM